MRAIELFNSWQGEGKHSGVLETFLRFKACKLPFCDHLCPFCDTILKMKMSNEFEVTDRDLEKLLVLSNWKLCITGGEPGLYLNDIKHIIENYSDKLNLLEIETNGLNLKEMISILNQKYLIKENFNVNINLSPKIFKKEEAVQYAKMIKELEYNRKFIENNMSIKLVVSNDNFDLQQYFLVNLATLKLNYLYKNVYVMPMGKSENEMLSNSNKCIDLAMKFNLNITSRLHIIYNFI